MVRILIIVAHPDDAEVYAGGTTALWRRRGDRVRFLSLTSGNAGHFSMSMEDLAKRRRAEARKVAELAEIEYEILENDDGCLEPNLDRRLDLIRRIRTFAPDLILTHRPNDYHPDHRYTAILLQDSAYMVTVPMICPEVEHLQTNPVIAYLHDDFTKPSPFAPDVVVNVDPVMDLKWEMLHAHASQYYEWLPYNDGVLEEVPVDEARRREWLRKQLGPHLETVAESYRPKLQEAYGEEVARRIRYAEAFELSEYGERPGGERSRQDRLRKLFPI